MWYKNIAGRFFGLVTKHACDRRTDGQNYDSQDRTSIAASRGKNQRRKVHKHYSALTIGLYGTCGRQTAVKAPRVFANRLACPLSSH